MKKNASVHPELIVRDCCIKRLFLHQCDCNLNLNGHEWVLNVCVCVVFSLVLSWLVSVFLAEAAALTEFLFEELIDVGALAFVVGKCDKQVALLFHAMPLCILRSISKVLHAFSPCC